MGAYPVVADNNNAAAELIQRPFEQPRDNFLRVEALLGEAPRQLALVFVIRGDLIETTRGLVEIVKTEDPRIVGENPARPGVLHDRGFAAGEITERAIADPRVLQSHAR